MALLPIVKPDVRTLCCGHFTTRDGTSQECRVCESIRNGRYALMRGKSLSPGRFASDGSR